MSASHREIIGKPPSIARLPIEATNSAEISAKRIRAAQKIEKKTGRHRILVTKPGPASHLDWRFLFHDLVHYVFPCNCVFAQGKGCS